MRWDIFCKVIDNHGDIGVCWRLARELARARRIGAAVDRRRRRRWPGWRRRARPACEVRALGRTQRAGAQPGDVVVEAFGCDPPPGFVAAHGRAARPRRRPGSTSNTSRPNPTWSAATACPRPCCSGPGAGLAKHFFYPGFTRAHRRPAARAGPGRAAARPSTARPGCARRASPAPASAWSSACSATSRRACPQLLRAARGADRSRRACWSPPGRAAGAPCRRCSRTAGRRGALHAALACRC